MNQWHQLGSDEGQAGWGECREGAGSGAGAHSPARVALVVGPMPSGTSSSWYCSPARVLYTTLYSWTSASLLSHSRSRLVAVREPTRRFLGASISTKSKASPRSHGVTCVLRAS